MTTPVERTNAVLYTEQFLYELCDTKKTPRVPRAIREKALRLIRHYPSEYDMKVIVDKEDGKSFSPLFHKVFGKGYA